MKGILVFIDGKTCEKIIAEVFSGTSTRYPQELIRGWVCETVRLTLEAETKKAGHELS